jgi:microcystin-dependent protein
MANYEATRYDFDGAFLTGIEGVNTGIVVPWGSAIIPSGFLECNGASVSTSTYAALFAVIGYTYGGSGASFNLPDLTDRTVVNKSNTKSLAQTGGANTVTPTGNISGSTGSTTLTTNTIPSHSHSVPVYNPGGAAYYCGLIVGGGCGGVTRSNTAYSTGSNSTGGGQSHDHTLSANFSGSANSVLQPYLVLIYIIKT